MSIRDVPKSDTWHDSGYSDTLQVVSTLYAAVTSTDEDENTQQEYRCEMSPHLGYTVLDTFHDPFIGGGQGLTERQLSLNHIYMHSLAPALLANPATRSPYSPGIYMTQLCLKNSAVGALWTSILAEEMISKMGGLPRTTEMEVQRVAGNRALRLILTNFRTDFQAAYLALIKAAQVSLFVGDSNALFTQFLATEMAIKAVGGLKNALALCPDVEPFYMSSFPFYQASILTTKSLNQVTSRFLDSVQHILHQAVEGRRASFDGGICGDLEGSCASDNDLILEEEIITNVAACTTFTGSPSTANLKSILVLLMELCWTFIVLRHDPEVRTETLQYIKVLLNTCGKSQSEKQDRKVTTRTRAAMVAHARRDKLRNHSFHHRLETDLFITQMEMDGYKIFDYPVNPGRAIIVTRLYAWLTRDPHSGRAFSATELGMLKNEIMCAWMQ